ncbi:MAG: hypothetical protein ACSHX5_04675 [Phycisphaerales bacterium]
MGKRTHAELEVLLEEHMGFIKLSAAAFDDGALGESKRLAVSIRVLLHDTNKSHSLLKQLGSKYDYLYVDTAAPHPPIKNNRMALNRLAYIGFPNKVPSYFAPLDLSGYRKNVTFKEWWDDPVIGNSVEMTYSRKKLILEACNKDGGAHVDPKLTEQYRNLCDGSLLNIFDISNQSEVKLMADAEKHSVRQIAHELLCTLDSEYSMDPSYTGTQFSMPFTDSNRVNTATMTVTEPDGTVSTVELNCLDANVVNE